MPEDRLLKLVVEALEELKANDIEVLDVRELTDVADYMVVASGRSARQVCALADNVVQRAKEAGFRPIGVEGKDGGEWVLVDLCDVIAHVMQPRIREFYQLERLWSVSQGHPDTEHGQGAPRALT
jgi:ribosome-associated protein